MTDEGKEEIEDTVKISMPLITNLELQELDNNMDSIVEQYTKLFIHNKELAMLQHIIKKQQAEIEKKDKIIDEMAKWLYEEDNLFGFGIFKEINTPEKIKEYFKKKVGTEEK